jgi:hypothetical protein
VVDVSDLEIRFGQFQEDIVEKLMRSGCLAIEDPISEDNREIGRLSMTILFDSA